MAEIECRRKAVPDLEVDVGDEGAGIDAGQDVLVRDGGSHGGGSKGRDRRLSHRQKSQIF